MAKKGLPNFLIYQANEKEFHICLEAEGKFLRWCSNYPPTLDVRFPRPLTQIEDKPLYKMPSNKVFDEGSYTVSKSATREAIESKITAGVNMKTFSFILNGKKLKGRFSIKRNANHTVIQKFKDKFAVEEDVLSGDLARTIRTMVPGYDAKKVKLNPAVKPEKKPPRQEVELVELPPVEVVTADTKINGVAYHFALYTSTNEPDVCLVTSVKGDVMVLKKVKNSWLIQTPLARTLGDKENKFADHANLLFPSDD